MSDQRPASVPSPRSPGTGRARRGRPPLTDRTALVAAARQVGFSDLTVGAVTARAGVRYSTFYRHFPNFDALVAALADEVLGDVDLPDPDRSWQAYLAETCAALLDLLDRWPGLGTTITRLPALPEPVVAIFQGLTDALRRAGFDSDDAALGALWALETVAGSDQTAPGGAAQLTQRQHRLDHPPHGDPPGAAAAARIDPHVRAATIAHPDRNGSAGRWTTRKIDLLIEGLHARLPAG